jgi:hypothetical protein
MQRLLDYISTISAGGIAIGDVLSVLGIGFVFAVVAGIVG